MVPRKGKLKGQSIPLAEDPQAAVRLWKDLKGETGPIRGYIYGCAEFRQPEAEDGTGINNSYRSEDPLMIVSRAEYDEGSSGER